MRILRNTIAVLLAVTAGSMGAATVGSATSPLASPDILADRMVAMHNAVRAEVGVGPVRWNPRLADDAAQWARHLAETRRFEHDRGAQAEAEGENLWMGTRGHYPVEAMLRLWIEERKEFRPGRFPDNSRTGSWHDVGHYTQMVWRDTREVGCAIGHNDEDEFLVCRYAEPGNVVGDVPF